MVSLPVRMNRSAGRVSVVTQYNIALGPRRPSTGLLGASTGIYIAWECIDMKNALILISPFVLIIIWIVRLALL